MGIQPKACSIKVHFILWVQGAELVQELWCDVLGVYAVVIHTVFRCVCVWVLPKWVYRGKKIAAQNFRIVTLSFSGGDSRPLPKKC
jgi:hypothetical protein